jgi:hypothetical protein
MVLMAWAESQLFLDVIPVDHLSLIMILMVWAESQLFLDVGPVDH